MTTPDPAAITWHKSSRSSGGANNCVELGTVDGRSWHAIRDSKDPHGPFLPIGDTAIASFVAQIKAGRLD
jgi:hypothetical protein